MKCGDPNNPDGPGMTRYGKNCQRDCEPAHTRCYLHGGRTPGAIIKAQQTMAVLRFPVIETLAGIVEQFNMGTCLSCGFPTGDTDEKRMVIRACEAILDRCGMGRSQTITVTPQSDGDLDLALLSPGERTTLLAAILQVKAIKSAVRERQNAAQTSDTPPLVM